MSSSRRRSGRLSGTQPDLTLQEASAVLDSPAGGRRRRLSGSSSIMSNCSETPNLADVAEDTNAPAPAPLPVRKRTLFTEKFEPIQEEIAEEKTPGKKAKKDTTEVEVIEIDDTEEEETKTEEEETKTEEAAPETERLEETDSKKEPEAAQEKIETPKVVVEEASTPVKSTEVESTPSDKENGLLPPVPVHLDSPPPPATEPAPTEIAAKKPASSKPASAVADPVVKGRCKSGRFWKSDRDRFRSIVKSKGLKQNFRQTLQRREDRRRAQELEAQIKEKTQREKDELRARQEENKKRREENERKSEVVQVIKNPAKLKRMKKKQLRMLAKRDTTNVSK